MNNFIFASRKRGWAVIAGLLLLTFAVFSPALNNGFTNWDDNRYVKANPKIHTLSADSVGEVFTRLKMGTYHYMPLTYLTWMIERHFFGLNPAVYILNNILLHLFNTVLVFRLMFLLGGRFFVAILVSFLFALHPMHVESVAWIPERKDVLYTAFFLAALMSYTGYLKEKKLSRWALTWFLSLCSLWSKPAAISLPVVLVLMDYYFKRPWTGRVLYEKIPFFALSFFFGWVAVSQKAGFADVTAAFTLGDRIVIASYALLQYVLKLVLPFGLSSFYPYPMKTGAWLPLEVYFGPVVLILTAGLIIKNFPALHRIRTLWFGVLFFLTTLFPSLGVVPVGNYFMADRYTYVSYLGLFFAAVVGLDVLYQRVSSPKRKGMMASILAFLVLCAVLSHQRVKVWRSGLTLWNDVAMKYPDLPMAYGNRALGYFEIGDYERGIRDLAKAIEMKPDWAPQYSNRGIAYSRTGQYDLAEQDFTRAIELDADFLAPYVFRAELYIKLKRYEEAAADLKRVKDIIPFDPYVKKLVDQLHRLTGGERP